MYVVESKGLRPFYLILEIDSANVFVLFINQSITFVANLWQAQESIWRFEYFSNHARLHDHHILHKPWNWCSSSVAVLKTNGNILNSEKLKFRSKVLVFNFFCNENEGNKIEKKTLTFQPQCVCVYILKYWKIFSISLFCVCVFQNHFFCVAGQAESGNQHKKCGTARLSVQYVFSYPQKDHGYIYYYLAWSCLV